MNCVDAGNVLVHLFLQTKTQYVLTNKKLQYLLIIGQMASLSCGRPLFEEDIQNFKQGFVLDVICNNFMSGTEIVSGACSDTALHYDVDSFVLPYTNKMIFKINKLPSAAEKMLLIKVFLSFGAYKEETLRRLLGDFKSLRNVPVFSVVDKKKIRSCMVSEIRKEKNLGNPVLLFVKEQYAEHLESIKPTQKSVIPESSTANETQAAPGATGTGMLPLELTRATSPETPVQDTAAPAAVAGPAPSVVLRGMPSLQNIVAGKQYAIMVELSSPKCDCEISIFAVDINRELPVTREALSDTLIKFTFYSVASNIKISARVV